MKNINLFNYPLRKPIFLIKTKYAGTNFINIFGALSDKSLYFRKKSKLNGSAFLVGVNRVIENFLCKLNINDLLDSYNHYMDLHVKLSNFNVRIKTWLQKDRMPLEFIRIISLVLANNQNEQKKLLAEIFSKIRYITDRSGTSKFKPPFLLKDILHPCRIYDVGVSMGDGGLFKHRQEITDGSVNGEDLDLVKKYLEKLKKLKKNIWGLSDNSISLILGKKENKNMYKLVVSNKSYVRYLNFVYGLPIGDKIKQGLREPEIINLAGIKEKNLLRRFLYRGLFDTDGSYIKDASSISFWTSSLILFKQTQEFLQELNLTFTSASGGIKISSKSYRRFLEMIGSSHESKLKTILNRLLIPPKSYFYKGVKYEKIINGYFNLEYPNFHISGVETIFKKFRKKVGLTQKEYAKRFCVSVGTIRYWEYGLNSIPFKEICRVLRLNGFDPYKELSKRGESLNIGKLKLPLKPSKSLLEIVPFLIPQKSFNHACVIKREGMKLSNDEMINLIQKIETFFNCKVKINKSTGAFYVYSTYLALFLETFFIYEKSWLTMNNSELNTFYNRMNKFLEVNMEEKLPFEKIERKILTKREAETDKRYGKIPEERKIKDLLDYGIININKPDGPTWKGQIASGFRLCTKNIGHRKSWA